MATIFFDAEEAAVPVALAAVEGAVDLGLALVEELAVPLRRSALRMKPANVSFPPSLLLMVPTAPCPHAPGEASKNHIGVFTFSPLIATLS